MKQPFYGDNEHRDYPFITRTDPLSFVPDDGGPLNNLPHSAIVDFGAIFFPAARFTDYANDYVFLASIERLGRNILYRFGTTAPGALPDDCVFVRNIDTAEEFENQWIRSGELGLATSSSSFEDRAPTWEAFLVTGTLDDVLEMLPADGIVHFGRGLWRIEPARVQTLAGAAVTSINVANYPRNVAPACIDADLATSGSSTTIPGSPIVVARGMTGDIRLVDGYNATIRQDTQNVALIIGAGVGAGEGQACEEIPRFPGETSPDGGAFLTGGPGCGQLVTSLNGVGGKNISLDPGYGFTIKPSPSLSHTLVIATDPTATAACRDSSESLGG